MAAREALRAYCKEHLTYSKDPALKCTIKPPEVGVIYRVQLDTFVERRQVQWAMDPYAGALHALATALRTVAAAINMSPH